MKTKDKTQQAEALESTVNISGTGEDPAVRALLSDEFVDGSNKEASDIAMALVQIIRGQKMLGEQVAKINERMSEMDKDALKREDEQKKYIQEVLDKAESLKKTGAEKDRIIARGSQVYADAMKAAHALLASNAIAFEEALRTMPTESVVSPGELIVVNENGQQVSKLIPEVIRIRNKTWVIPPGIITNVPKIVAERMRSKRKSEAETDERKKLLSSNLESSKLIKGWQDINSKYGSKTEALPQ